MSHAMGQVIYDGKIVGYYEYNGTSDIACSKINPTQEECQKNWRGDNYKECTCGNPPVPVILWCEYAAGYHWPAEACLECGAITGGRNVMDLDPIDGHPLGEEFETEWTRMCREF